MDVNDVSAALENALAWIKAIVSIAFDNVVGFVYGFLPDADSSVIGVINGWMNMMRGDDLSFNFYYFLDMPMVLTFMSVWITVTVAALAIMAVRFVLDIVHKVMDSIPIIG